MTEGLGWTFDTAAAAYEKMRPGYPKELYRAIFACCPVGESSRAVEVGIGGGQATRPVLETGCAVTAVDCGENLAALCREKFRDFHNFQMVVGNFEELDFPDGQYDLVYSASAFHWIPEQAGYQKVFSMLKSGGVFARFANHPYPDKRRPELSDEIQKLYTVYMNSVKKPSEYTAEMARKRAEIALSYGFCDIRQMLFQRTRSFTAKEYTALLGTYSDHIALEETKRQAFFAEIERVINFYGGEFTLYDTIDLELARKP